MNGVIVINKPAEFTSFDVVALMRGLTKQRKIGHCGTLDPNATGVLPLLLGSATKAQDIIPNHDKEYIASMQFGITTDTLDIWGSVKTQTQSVVTSEALLQAAESFKGEIYQLPPMYSAVKINGQRLYDIARTGAEVERTERKITVYKLELLGFDEQSQTAQIRVACSKGTYIRSLIDDIGKKLGCGAVMTALERTSACGYTTEDSVTVEEARALCAAGTLEQKIRPTESLFYSVRALTVSENQARRFSNGGALDISRTSVKTTAADGEVFRIKAPDTTFLGLAKADRGTGELKLFKLFK